VIEKFAVFVQDFESVTVNEYDPANAFVKSSTVDVTGPVQLYVYPGVPPVTFTLTPPVAAPKQFTLDETPVIEIGSGALMTTAPTTTHPVV
jgi:hypothetical protein